MSTEQLLTRSLKRNLIYSKKLFWFGSDSVDLKAIGGFKADKAADVAHHITAWAAETGKGLLFFSEKSDKATPHGVVQLAEASEPVTDGANKFHFTSKGHKHTFKASTSAERDNWVAQLKAKIAEAKELAAQVTESETYKKTLEALKPAPVKKEEKVAAPAAEAAAAPAAEEATTEAAVAEPATEEVAKETSKEEAPKEEVKKDEPKRRSASRKRTSIFGSLPFVGKKEEKKSTEVVAEPAATETAATEAPAAAEETPAAEPTVEAAAEPVAEVAAPAEAKPEEKKEDGKPTPSKRGSIFGTLSFGKKKVASPEPTPVVEDKPAPAEPVAETAPVIPAVETTEPLSAEVSSPATVPTETVEAAPVTNGETAKETKVEKKKSPFAFGKKEKTTSDEEGEKPKSPSTFSKFRATIKGKGKAPKAAKAEEKAEDKTEETPAEAETSAAAAEPAAEEAAKPVEVEAPVTEEAPKPVASAPVVTAAA